MLLAIDTSQNLCSVCLYDANKNNFLFARADVIEKNISGGHAEHLLPMLESELKKANCSWQSITSLAVVRGPGSFTGLRVGLAVAKALALALNIPCVAVSAFEVLAFGNSAAISCQVKVGNKIWCQDFKTGEASGKPYPVADKKIESTQLDIKQVALLAKEKSPSDEISALYLSEPL